MAIYTFEIFRMSSSYGGTVLDSVVITVDDVDDSIGIGDRHAGDRGVSVSETGSVPTITAVSDPAFNSLIGSSITFDEQGQFSGGSFTLGGGEDYFAIGFNSHGGAAPDGFRYVSQHPDASANITVGETYTRSSGRSVLEAEGQPVAICFTSGTLIKTQSGEVAIEGLTIGDMVLTIDHGYQPIRWIGSSKRPATGDLAPILIRKGALRNDRDLRVSPQHRMLLQGWQAELLFGETEVLTTAKSLVNDHSIIRVEGGEVEYFHILFDTHEIIYAEGAPSESFHPGEQGWKALDEPTRDEILELFPELFDGDFSNYGSSARISLKHKEGQLLGQYMLQENQANEGNPNA